MAIRQAGWPSFQTESTATIAQDTATSGEFQPVTGAPQAGEVFLVNAGRGPHSHAVIVNTVAAGKVTSFYGSQSKGPAYVKPGTEAGQAGDAFWQGAFNGGEGFIICLPDAPPTRAGGGGGGNPAASSVGGYPSDSPFGGVDHTPITTKCEEWVDGGGFHVACYSYVPYVS